MKSSGLRLWYLVPAFISLAAAGCVTSESYTLNEVSLSGPVARTPIYVTINPVPGTVQIIPGFALDNAPAISGMIEPEPPPAALPGHNSGTAGNLTWDVPGSEYSLDLQIIAVQHVGLTAGGTYAAAGGYQFTNFRVGIGLFTVENQFAIRLDAGAQFNALRYRSRVTVTATVEGPFVGHDQYVSNFDDTGVQQSIGAALGLTLNSAYTESIVNGFLHIGVAWQPLINYNPANPDTVLGAGDGQPATGNVKSTTAVLTFGGGIALELGNGHRVLLGVRGAQLLDVTPAPGVVWQPFFELVFTF